MLHSQTTDKQIQQKQTNTATTEQRHTATEEPATDQEGTRAPPLVVPTMGSRRRHSVRDEKWSEELRSQRHR